MAFMLRRNTAPAHRQQMVTYRQHYANRILEIRQTLGLPSNSPSSINRTSQPRPQQRATSSLGQMPNADETGRPKLPPAQPTTQLPANQRRLPARPLYPTSPSTSSRPSPDVPGKGRTPPSTPSSSNNSNSSNSNSNSNNSNSNNRGDQHGSFEDYFAVETEPDKSKKLTCVDSILLRVGARTFHGGMLVPTEEFQKGLKDILSKQPTMQHYATLLGVRPPSSSPSPSSSTTSSSTTSTASHGVSHSTGGASTGGAGRSAGDGRVVNGGPHANIVGGDDAHNPSQPKRQHRGSSSSSSSRGGGGRGSGAPAVRVGADGRLIGATEDHHQDTTVQRPDRPDSG